MKTWIALVCLGWCLACSDSTPATERGAIEVLADDAPELCASACGRLDACQPECQCEGDLCECSGGEDCPSECQQEANEARGMGERCAAAFLAVIDCVEASDCNAVDGDCRNAQDQFEVACDEQGEGVDSKAPGQSDNPPVATGVTCSQGFGGGAAGAGNAPIVGLVCEQGWDDCSDGHTYRVACVDHEGSGTAGCSCIVDGMVATGFTIDSSACPPSGSLVNESCGWNLR